MYYITMLREYGFKFFKYFIEDKKAFFKYFTLSFIVGVLELFGVALTYPFISKLMSEDGFNHTTTLYGILIIVAFLTKNLFMIFYNSLQANFTKTTEANIAKRFINYFLYGEYNTVSKISFAKKSQIVGFLTSCAMNNFFIRILNLIVNIFVFVLIMGFLFAKFFVATCVTLIFSIVLLLSQSKFFRAKTAHVSKLMNQANQELNEAFNEPLLNLKNIKILNSEDYFYQRYVHRQGILKKYSTNLLFYNSITPYVTEPFIIIILLVLLAIISVQNMSDTATLVASYAVIVSAIFRLSPTISRIQVNLTGLNNALPQVKELVQYYEKFNLNEFRPKEKAFCNFNQMIELKDVSFSYDNKIVLNHVNMKIPKGKFIGIAGNSGVGKTTLVDILSGLLQIKSGQIHIDGIFIEGKEMPKLKIGYIPQDYGIISASIRENVAFGCYEIDDEKVIKALKSAQLYDYITKNFEKGIYAKPFVDSTGFSQGQKQRLAIARALYLEPDIIILDEATSSLDLKTEEEICEMLNSLKGEKTIIAIAHRLSTIKNADIIFMMQNSTITDNGSFEELCNKNPEFKRLVELNNANLIH